MTSKMRVIDKIDTLDRRHFLGGSAGAVAVAAAASFVPGQAMAVPLKNTSAEAFPTLVRMSRDLYPHDRLPDSVYETAVQTIDGQLSADPQSKALLTNGAQQLDAAAVAMRRKPYLAIDGEADRVAVLRSIEQTPFFKTMRSGMVTALYNQEGMWPKLGYEGSSAEKGGYLHRGFDDIDWLPA